MIPICALPGSNTTLSHYVKLHDINVFVVYNTSNKTRCMVLALMNILCHIVSCCTSVLLVRFQTFFLIHSTKYNTVLDSKDCIWKNEEGKQILPNTVLDSKYRHDITITRLLNPNSIDDTMNICHYIKDCMSIR